MERTYGLFLQNTKILFLVIEKMETSTNYDFKIFRSQADHSERMIFQLEKITITGLGRKNTITIIGDINMEIMRSILDNFF